jgi:Family of unknown function (DUF6049)
MRSRRAAAPAPARLLARLVLGGSLLAGLALPALVTPVLGTADPAAAATADGARRAAAAPAAAVTITGVSPSYARPGGKIRVSGILRNTTTAPVRGVTVQLRSSSLSITDRDDLASYAAGSGPSDELEPGALARIAGPVAPGATVAWTAVLPVNEVHMSVFGVYPLAAEAATSVATLGTSRTFLPFWPTGRGAVQPREDLAWIWPLIDSPDNGPCPGLLDNDLAASVSNGGRLAGLLSAGSSAAGQADQLTWVIDPALLASAQTMAGPGSYQTGASAACSPATTHAASAPAAAWLAKLRSAVAGQPAVATPYADVDIAALVQQNLDGDVHQAFADGRSAASRILKQDLTPAPAAGQPTAASLTTALAWPADGLANYPMLETLAAVDGIKTVVLASSAMPPVGTLPYTPSAVSSTPDGEGGDMRVLLADSTLTQILGSVTAQSDPAGASFAAQQMFLAQTAMIAAESPHLSRAIVVAPPRRWDPPADLASGLLADTASAPWLTPVSAGTLAADTSAAGRVARQAPQAIGPGLTGAALLRGAAQADQAAAVVQSMRLTPNPRLNPAIAAVESSAWRGSAAGQQQARVLLRRVQRYLSQQETSVSIVEPGRDTLGGQTGPIPISVDNRLPYTVQVRVQFSVNQDRGGDFRVLSSPGVIRIPPREIITKKVKVRASSIGSTTVTLRLLAPNGQALPGTPVNMTVQSTQLGTLALVVLAAALAVFMITSASRAIRRGRSAGGPAPAGAPGPPDAPGQGSGGAARGDAGGPAGREPGPGDRAPDPGADRGTSAQASRGAGSGQAHPTGRGGHEQAEETDNVVHDRAAPGTAGTDLAATEDADDYARVPGWADRR